MVRNLFSFASCLAPQVGGNCRLILLVVLISASGLRIASGEVRPRGGKPDKIIKQQIIPFKHPLLRLKQKF